MERTSSVRRKAMARQHKAEVMIAGEQLRYEETDVVKGGTNVTFQTCDYFDHHLKVETSRWKTDQGSSIPLAHISELLCGGGADRLAHRPQGGFGSSNSSLSHAAPHGP